MGLKETGTFIVVVIRWRWGGMGSGRRGEVWGGITVGEKYIQSYGNQGREEVARPVERRSRSCGQVWGSWSWRIGRRYPGIEEREDGRAGKGKERGEAVVGEVWSPGTAAQNHRGEDPTR